MLTVKERVNKFSKITGAQDHIYFVSDLLEDLYEIVDSVTEKIKELEVEKPVILKSNAASKTVASKKGDK